MENDIALAASGYLLARIAGLILFAYLIYRVLRPSPGREPVRARARHSASRQGSYAQERYDATRLQR